MQVAMSCGEKGFAPGRLLLVGEVFLGRRRLFPEEGFTIGSGVVEN